MKTLCPICKSVSIIKYNLSDYKYYSCSKCDLLFLHPQPTYKNLDKYYRNVFNHSAGVENKKKLINQSKKVVRKLKDLNPNGKTILDIGSGLGLLLDEAGKKGLLTTAIEPSKRLIKNKEYKNVSKVYNCSFESFIKLRSKDKYDFITLTHVIEHVKDPKTFLNNVLRLLNNKGVLFIETPNLDSHLYKAEKAGYTFLIPPEHVILYSRKSLSRIIPHPYSIIKTSTYSYSEHLMGIIKVLLKKKAPVIKTGNDPCAKKVRRYSITKQLKYLTFDKLIAPSLYRLLNLNHNGSILELYVSKN